ncbi:hypothetical protein JB92DRAFT_3253466 [Gautieria morchelliformis]|nr:hypothetical protein JB92DRAFT_3253466 [Gautieria morchelliformis]
MAMKPKAASVPRQCAGSRKEAKAAVTSDLLPKCEITVMKVTYHIGDALTRVETPDGTWLHTEYLRGLWHEHGRGSGYGAWARGGPDPQAWTTWPTGGIGVDPYAAWIFWLRGPNAHPRGVCCPRPRNGSMGHAWDRACCMSGPERSRAWCMDTHEYASLGMRQVKTSITPTKQEYSNEGYLPHQRNFDQSQDLVQVGLDDVPWHLGHRAVGTSTLWEGRAWRGWGRTSASLDDAACGCNGLVVLYGGVGHRRLSSSTQWQQQHGARMYEIELAARSRGRPMPRHDAQGWHGGMTQAGSSTRPRLWACDPDRIHEAILQYNMSESTIRISSPTRMARLFAAHGIHRHPISSNVSSTARCSARSSMSSSTSAAISALLDAVIVSAVAPEHAEFELAPTPAPAAAIGFHRKVLTGSGMGRANAQLTIFLFTASIGLSIKSCDSFCHEEQLGQLPGAVVENLGSLRSAERAGGPVTVQEGSISCVQSG